MRFGFSAFFSPNCIRILSSIAFYRHLTISKVSTQSEESNCFWPQPWFSYSFGASLLKVTGKIFHDLPRDPWQHRTSRDSLHEPSSSWQDRPADLLPTPCQKSQRLCPHFVGPSNVKGLKNWTLLENMIFDQREEVQKNIQQVLISYRLFNLFRWFLTCINCGLNIPTTKEKCWPRNTIGPRMQSGGGIGLVVHRFQDIILTPSWPCLQCWSVGHSNPTLHLFVDWNCMNGKIYSNYMS